MSEKDNVFGNDEKRELIAKRRAKKALRSYRFRPWKNFCFWLLGVFSSFFILFGTIFVAFKVVPLKTYVGKDTEEYLSENVANKSIADALLAISTFKFGDFPVIDVELQKALKEIGVDEYVVINFEGLKDVKFFNDADGSDLISEITKNISLNPEGIDKDGKIKAFREYQPASPKVEKSENGWVLTDGTSPSLYYYKEDAPAAFAAGEEENYRSAFDADGKLVAALSGKITSAEDLDGLLYFQPISKMPVLEVVDNLSSVLGRLSLNEIFSLFDAPDAEGGESFIEKIFDGINIGDLLGEFDVEKLLNNITLADLGGAEILGDLGTLSVFESFEQVPDEELPERDADGNIADVSANNPKQYYYLVSDGDEQKYERAFDDEGKAQVGSGETLYYANLSEVPLTSLTELIGDSIGRVRVNEILAVFGAEIEEGGMIDKIIGQKRIKEMGSIDASSVHLCDILPDNEENRTLIDVLLEATGVEDYKDLTVEDIGGFEFDGIKLSTVVDLGTNDTLKEILSSTVSGESGEPVSYEDLTVEDLSKIDINKLKLSVVIDSETNGKLFEILAYATGFDPNDKDNITIGDINNFSVDNIKLSSVLDVKKGDDIYDILVSAIPSANGDFDNITIADLGSFDVSNLKLSVVLPITDENSGLYDLLADATGVGAEEITVENLASFDINKVHLHSVLGEVDEKLQKVLCQSLGADNYGSLTVGSLSGKFDVNNIQLNTIFDDKESTGNDILDALLKREGVTVGNLGEEINSLSVSEIYNVECFSTVENGAEYAKKDNDFYLVSNLSSTKGYETGYYISKEASIWLFLMYNTDGEYDESGNAKVYTCEDLTFGNMEESLKNISSKVMNATVRQLVDAGIISADAFTVDRIYVMTLQQVVDTVGKGLSLVS